MLTSPATPPPPSSHCGSQLVQWFAKYIPTRHYMEPSHQRQAFSMRETIEWHQMYLSNVIIYGKITVEWQGRPLKGPVFAGYIGPA